MAAAKKRKAQQRKSARAQVKVNAGADDFMKFARRSIYRLLNDVKKAFFSKRGIQWLKE